MPRGTKKTIAALEQKFETQKKPVEQDFFDLLASFYHKDEDLAFLISLSKATVTDVEAGEDHTRFMTALRTYQAIQFWTRLAKLSNLYQDVNALIMQRINEMWVQLLANNDSDNVINTLGEVFAAFNNFNEWTGGLRAEFSHFYSVLRDMNGERVVRNTFDNHDGRIGNLEYRMRDVPNNDRQVQNSFDDLFSRLRDLTGDRVVANSLDSLDGRLDGLESILADITGYRSVKNDLDTLFSRLRDMTGDRVVRNEFDSHSTRIDNAQARANQAYDKGVEAKNRADDAHNIIGRPGDTTEQVWSRITNVNSYAVAVAQAGNQVQTMLNGYTFGGDGVVKADYNFVRGLLSGYTTSGEVKAAVDGLYAIVSGFTGSGSIMGEIQDVRNKLRDAGIVGF